uniref:Uncharacterized protein n=1 Tax=Meloidogyne enterolobii TaxID=390850 RepID=A0A6V7UTE0_MELEN|nr:unnamed protein product [Meloidogyne enterolobii]CAD2179786.1 unnamed protein product [Meloidogyne enterolobii]
MKNVIISRKNGRTTLLRHYLMAFKLINQQKSQHKSFRPSILNTVNEILMFMVSMVLEKLKIYVSKKIF